MRVRVRRADARRQGVALVYAVFGVFVAASMVTVMFTMAGVTNNRATERRGSVQAQYLADGAIDAVRRLMKNSVASWSAPVEDGDVMIDGIPVAYTIEQTEPTFVNEDEDGIRRLIDRYEIVATATVDGYQQQAHRIINVESMPIFQFAVFYDDDLEMVPGPSMTLKGRVHSNSDMYLGCGGTLSLDTNYVRAAGDVSRSKMGSATSGTIDIRKWVSDPFDASQPVEFVAMNSKSQMSDLGIDTDTGFDSDFMGYDHFGDGDFLDAEDWLPFVDGALDFWQQPDDYTEAAGHTLLTGEHGVQEAVPPGLESIKMFEPQAGGDYTWNETSQEYDETPGTGTHAKGYFHKTASLSIIVTDDDPPEIRVYDPAGEAVVLPDGALTYGSVYDARQADGSGEYTPILSIDVGLLDDSTGFPDNGLIYVAQYGMGNGTDAKGVQLTNGAELHGDLTVVSEGSVYVHGNYNTVNKKSASVIADAVNLLSESWDGSKEPGELPVAAETTYNLALISGNKSSEADSYSGGFENLPRFHENWSGVACNISGSFVCTWESSYANSGWGSNGDRYKPPLRNWNYDASFNSVASLPPYTPMVVQAVDVVSW
jgi:hypothetical protein